jgi:hypothetical protein
MNKRVDAGSEPRHCRVKVENALHMEIAEYRNGSKAYLNQTESFVTESDRLIHTTATGI